MVDVEQIKQILAKHFEIDGQISIDHNTGTVDVDGDVYLKTQTSQLPVQFGRVSRNFYCSNKRLFSLEGAPNSVGGNFSCYNNQLETLEGAPSSVGGSFNCSNNQLETLDGAPNSVGGSFYCDNNQLGSLDGAPSSVGREFWVDYSQSLPLLKLLQYKELDISGAPAVVTEILLKYAGTGKKNILLATRELVKAGFKENARW
jgi:hypothetical protein